MRLNELEKTGLNITRKAMKIQLSGVKKGRSDANTEGCPPTKKSRSQKSTPEIIWEVVRTTTVKPRVWRVESWLEDENCILCFDTKMHKRIEVMRIDVQSEAKFTSSILEKTPSGKAYIKLDGKSCVALAFELEPDLEFHDVDNLAETVHRYSTELHKLGCIYASPSNILFYEDRSKRGCSLIHAIDCNFMPPRKVQDIPPVVVGKNVAYMCLLQNDKQLLITAHGSYNWSCVQAHDIATGERQWILNVSHLFWSVSHIERMKIGDGPCDFLLCGDEGSGVHKFSANGDYLGPLLTNGDLYRCKNLRWSEVEQCLYVVHVKNLHMWYVSKLLGYPGE